MWSENNYIKSPASFLQIGKFFIIVFKDRIPATSWSFKAKKCFHRATEAHSRNPMRSMFAFVKPTIVRSTVIIVGHIFSYRVLLTDHFLNVCVSAQYGDL